MIFHPSMTGRLSGFFRSVVTIQESSEIRDPITGALTGVVWTDVPGMEAIAGSLGPSGGQEVKTKDQTYVVSNYTLALNEAYTGIDETMRAVVDGQDYDILLVQHNSHGIKTRLLVNKVE